MTTQDTPTSVIRARTAKSLIVSHYHVADMDTLDAVGVQEYIRTHEPDHLTIDWQAVLGITTRIMRFCYCFVWLTPIMLMLGMFFPSSFTFYLAMAGALFLVSVSLYILVVETILLRLVPRFVDATPQPSVIGYGRAGHSSLARIVTPSLISLI